jgi:hypothetical protein
MVLLDDKDIKRAAGPGGPKGRLWVAEDPYEKCPALKANADPKI